MDRQRRNEPIISEPWQHVRPLWDYMVNCDFSMELIDFVNDVYRYNTVPERTMVVDFACPNIGGGCFSGGFAQEEQMVLQSHDLASRIAIQREHIGVQQVLAISGVYMDLWWPSAVAASRLNITASQVIQLGSPQLVVLAANAPNFNNRPKKYTKVALDMLIRKVHLIFMVAREKRSPMVLSGLLGGGAYRGNRPLVICLHMLFHEQLFPLKLHVPVFESYSSYPVELIDEFARRMTCSCRRGDCITLPAPSDEVSCEANQLNWLWNHGRGYTGPMDVGYVA